MNIRRRMFTLLLAFASLCAGCRTREMQQAGPCSCPREIETTQELEQTPEGWVGRQSSRMGADWRTAQFFDGDPRHGGVELRPKSSSVVKDRSTQTWHFNSRSGQPGIWMVCRYSDTGVALIRPVENEVSECSGKFISGYRVESLTCK